MNLHNPPVIKATCLFVALLSGCLAGAPEQEVAEANLDSCALHHGDAPACAARMDCFWTPAQDAPASVGTCRQREQQIPRSPIAGTYFGFNQLSRSWDTLVLTQPANGPGGFVLNYAGWVYRGTARMDEARLTLTWTSPIPSQLEYSHLSWTDRFGREWLFLHHAQYGSVMLLKSPYLYCDTATDCHGQAEPPQDATWTCSLNVCTPQGDYVPFESAQ